MTELQGRLLGLLKDIDKICRENEIDYFLFCGTLIGAVRHKGFVPWDDDADIIMSRDNWAKFLEASKKGLPEGIVISSMDLDPNIAMPVNHFVDTKEATIYRYHLTNPEVTGVPIDIQIMDPLPEGGRVYDEYIESILNLQDYTNPAYFYAARNIVHPGTPTQWEKWRRLEKSVGRGEVIRQIGEKTFHYPEEGAEYYVQRYGSAPLLYPREYFGKPKYVPFEDTFLPVPAHPEDVLTIAYGDWMMIPRGGSTKTQHDFAVRTESTPSQVLMEEFENSIDRKKMMGLYDERKQIQENTVGERVATVLEKDSYLLAKIRLEYEKKLAGTDLSGMIARGEVEELDRLFENYISAQCSDDYTGSPSVIGWKRWYRKHRPLLIDIGDEGIAAAILLLIREKKLGKAQRIVNARATIEREPEGLLATALKVFADTRSAISLFDRGQLDECAALVGGSLAGFADNPWLCVLDCRIRQSRQEEGASDLLNQYLGRFPEDDELMLLRAQELLSAGEEAKAFDLFEKIIASSDNGLVLTWIRENLEGRIAEGVVSARVREMYGNVLVQLGMEEDEVRDRIAVISIYHEAEDIGAPVMETIESLSDDDPGAGEDDEDEENEAESCAEEHVLTDEQRVRLNLLAEIDEICERNDILYTVWGNTLLQAVTAEQYLDTWGNLVIAMTTENAEKFMAVFEKEKPKDRYLESMKVNPRYHLMNLRYCDTTTLDFAISEAGERECYGIYVQIELLRHPCGGKLKDKLLNLVESGWQQQYTYREYSRYNKAAYTLVRALRAVRGKKTAGVLFDWFMKQSAKGNQNTYFLRPFRKPRSRQFKSVYFAGKNRLKLENVTCSGTRWSRLFADMFFRKKVTEENIRYAVRNPHNRIVSTEISSAEYLEALKAQGFDREKMWERACASDRAYAKVLWCDKQINQYWNKMCVIGEQHCIREKYKPNMGYLRTLYTERNSVVLWDELTYFREAKARFKRLKMPLKTDEVLTDLSANCKKPDAEDLAYFEWPLRCGRMRCATQRNLEAILAYLRKDIANCLYMYIDIAKYGLEHPNIKVWFDDDEKGQIRLVVMKYYGSISVYTAEEEFNLDGVMEIINHYGVATINAKRPIIEKIHERCSGLYDAEYGFVFKFADDEEMPAHVQIERAGAGDMQEAARVICADDEFGSMYDVDVLASQLAERIETGMGRSYVVRDNGKIYAHIASYAEFDGIATTSGLVVAKDHQDGLLGALLENYLVHRLRDDGFEVFTFVTKRLRKKLLVLQGHTLIGEYGKLVLKDEE